MNRSEDEYNDDGDKSMNTNNHHSENGIYTGS